MARKKKNNDPKKSSNELRDQQLSVAVAAAPTAPKWQRQQQQQRRKGRGAAATATTGTTAAAQVSTITGTPTAATVEQETPDTRARKSSFVGQTLLDALEDIDADQSAPGAATPFKHLANTTSSHSEPIPQVQAPAAPGYDACGQGYGYGYNVNGANAATAWMTAVSTAGGTATGAWTAMDRSILQPQEQYQSYWSNLYGNASATAQQAANYNQQHGQPHGAAWPQYQPQDQQAQLSGSIYGNGGVRHIHGHTHAFIPANASVMSVQYTYKDHNCHIDKKSRAPNRGFATRAGGRVAVLMSPENTTSESDDGGAAGQAWSHRTRAGRAAARSVAEDDASPWADLRNSPGVSGSPKKSSRAVLPVKKPEPTERYLSQTSNESSLRNSAQKLLIIIDLNGTLVHRPNSKDSSHIVPRPYARPFLKYLFDNHHIMVWSSARPENVAKMCGQLFKPYQRHLLVAQWGRDMLGLTSAQYNQKVQVYKQLEKVWNQADVSKWHPEHEAGERFGQHNTLLIDDTVLKASSEPFNLVQVDEFEAKPHQMMSDVLREVVGYLEEARWQTDVSAWVRSGKRFAVDEGWGFEWPEGTSSGVSGTRMKKLKKEMKKKEMTKGGDAGKVALKGEGMPDQGEGVSVVLDKSAGYEGLRK